MRSAGLFPVGRVEAIEEQHVPVCCQPPPRDLRKRPVSPVETFQDLTLRSPGSELPEPAVDRPDTATKFEPHGEPGEERSLVEVPQEQPVVIHHAPAVVAPV